MLEIGEDGELKSGEFSARGGGKDGSNSTNTPATQPSNNSNVGSHGEPGSNQGFNSAAQVSISILNDSLPSRFVDLTQTDDL